MKDFLLLPLRVATLVCSLLLGFALVLVWIPLAVIEAMSMSHKGDT